MREKRPVSYIYAEPSTMNSHSRCLPTRISRLFTGSSFTLHRQSQSIRVPVPILEWFQSQMPSKECVKGQEAIPALSMYIRIQAIFVLMPVQCGQLHTYVRCIYWYPLYYDLGRQDKSIPPRDVLVPVVKTDSQSIWAASEI